MHLKEAIIKSEGVLQKATIRVVFLHAAHHALIVVDDFRLVGVRVLVLLVEDIGVSYQGMQILSLEARLKEKLFGLVFFSQELFV
jgi:hypothetical protein